MSTSTEDSRPPAKRRRDDLESTPSEIHHHDSLYFENGNIVLFSAPKDNVITAFKVYQDYLALNSPVFEGMFSMPPPPTVEKYDDVPLVRLHDEVSQLIPFLSVIYDPMAIPPKWEFLRPSNTVESICRLSKKYQCDKILECMRYCLSVTWPKDLRSWDATMNNGADFPAGSAGPDPCSAIRLAREYDVPSILPGAFYQLLRKSSQALSRGQFRGGDRTGTPLANFESLSCDDVLTLFQGTLAIRIFIRDVFTDAEKHTLQGRADCDTFDRCYEAFSDIVKRHKDGAAHLNGDGLSVLQGPSIRCLRLGLCEACFLRHVTFMRQRRSALWDSLPVFFGVDKGRFAHVYN